MEENNGKDSADSILSARESGEAGDGGGALHGAEGELGDFLRSLLIEPVRDVSGDSNSLWGGGGGGRSLSRDSLNSKNQSPLWGGGGGGRSSSRDSLDELLLKNEGRSSSQISVTLSLVLRERGEAVGNRSLDRDRKRGGAV